MAYKVELELTDGQRSFFAFFMICFLDIIYATICDEYFPL